MKRQLMRSAMEALSIVAFMVTLVLPMLDMALRLDRTPALQEKRAHASLPPAPRSLAALAKFPAQFDHLGQVQVEPLDPAIIEALEARVQAAAEMDHHRLRVVRHELARQAVGDASGVVETP